MSIKWEDDGPNTPEQDDFDFMASKGAFAMKYFDDENNVFWGFFSAAGTPLSVKGLYKP